MIHFDFSSMIEKKLKTVGQPVKFIKSDGSEEEIFAVIESMYKRNKSKFEDNATKTGRNYNDYYIYIGPSSYDIFELGNRDYLLAGNDKYEIIKPEKIIAGGVIQSYRAIIKKIREDEDVFS